MELEGVRCPMAGCTRVFACDACMHAHLMRNYRLGYAEVFGPNQEAWVDFCDDHAACTPSALGL